MPLRAPERPVCIRPVFAHHYGGPRKSSKPYGPLAMPCQATAHEGNRRPPSACSTVRRSRADYVLNGLPNRQAGYGASGQAPARARGVLENCRSSAFSSCRQTAPGFAAASQFRRLGRRRLTLLMLKVAIFTARLLRAALVPPPPVGPVLCRPTALSQRARIRSFQCHLFFEMPYHFADHNRRRIW